MIQFIMMLLGLAFSDNNGNTVNNNGQVGIQQSNSVEMISPVDTGGEDGVIVPPKR